MNEAQRAEALRLAEDLDAYHTRSIHREAAALLRTLAEQQEQEPVAEIVGTEKRGFALMTIVRWEPGFERTKLGTKLYAAPVVQQQGPVIHIQEAWEAAGGNPGIKATKEELLTALRMLDEVCDEADAAPSWPQQGMKSDCATAGNSQHKCPHRTDSSHIVRHRNCASLATSGMEPKKNGVRHEQR